MIFKPNFEIRNPKSRLRVSYSISNFIRNTWLTMEKTVLSLFTFALLSTMLIPFAMMDAYAVPAPDTLFGGVARNAVQDTGSLVTIVQTDASQTLVGVSGLQAISGLAFGLDERLFAVEPCQGFCVFSTLSELNPNTGAVINTIGQITLTGVGDVKISDLANQPGTDILFGVTSAGDVNFDSGTIVTIDKTNAQITSVIGSLGIFGDVTPIAFAPDGTFYSSCGNCGPNLLVVDPTNANILSTIPLLPNPGNGLDSLAVRSDGTVFGDGRGNGFAPLTLYSINPVTGQTTAIGNGLRELGDIDFFPLDDIIIGGELIPLDTTALLLAGVQSISMWMIPVVVSGAGIGVFVIMRTRK